MCTKQGFNSSAEGEALIPAARPQSVARTREGHWGTGGRGADSSWLRTQGLRPAALQGPAHKPAQSSVGTGLRPAGTSAQPSENGSSHPTCPTALSPHRTPAQLPRAQAGRRPALLCDHTCCRWQGCLAPPQHTADSRGRSVPPEPRGRTETQHCTCARGCATQGRGSAQQLPPRGLGTPGWRILPHTPPGALCPSVPCSILRIRPPHTATSNTVTQHAQGYAGGSAAAPQEAPALHDTQVGLDQTCLKPTALRWDGGLAQPRRHCLLHGVSAGCWPHRGDQPGVCCPSCCSLGSASSGRSEAGPFARSSWPCSAGCSCSSAGREREQS